MSTKGTIAGVDLTAEVGGNTFHAHIHLYDDCFDEAPRPVYMEMWQQGVWSNPSLTIDMPQEKALELADSLTAWAASVRNMQGDPTCNCSRLTPEGSPMSEPNPDLRPSIEEIKDSLSKNLGVDNMCVRWLLDKYTVLKAENAKQKAVLDDLDFLRAEEGASVLLIGCDNPDFHAEEGCHIDVEGSWTRWEPRRFKGETLADALAKAAKAARKAGAE